jgi:hypothetical protein
MYRGTNADILAYNERRRQAAARGVSVPDLYGASGSADSPDPILDPAGWLEAQDAAVADAEAQEINALVSITDAQLDAQEDADILDWVPKKP